MSSVPERSEIDTEYRWDLEDIYATDEDWEAAFDAVRERISELDAFEGRATESAETLLAAFETHESVMREVAKVSTYANLRSSEDQRVAAYQSMATRAKSLAADARSAASYLDPELQALDADEFAAFVDEEPALAAWEHVVDDARRTREHTRSAEVEAVIADLSEVTGSANEVYSMLTDADMTFPTVDNPEGESVEITQNNFTTLQKNPDREFRERVHGAFYNRWGDVRNAVGTALQKSVTGDVKTARIRQYETAREAALDGPNVPVEVYDALLETVNDELGVLARHAELKRDLLGVDELRPWDLYASLTGADPEVSYEAACDHVVAAVEPLGEAYQARMREGLNSRWVDVYENRGKRSGAFSSGTYDTQPFVLMNYQDDVASMYTLAHELGHSMHSELAADAQPWQYADYDIFVAEAASTVNETLLTHHLLETVEDETFRRAVLDEYLERFRSTLFRQTMFADFELAIHEVVEEGGALTPDRLDEMYRERKESFYGPMVADDLIEREWMRIPHFYYNYYVYQYATGISAATAIVERVREEGADAAADYRAALELGGSEYPVDVLARAGVDVTTREPVEAAVGVYDDLVAEMRSLAG
jgi:oligopeptidase F. Metallo peptidase. MEROPS family M03B